MKKLAAAFAAALSLSACATVPKLDAASDIHAFLVSIRDGDSAAFEAHVDRAALKTNLRARVLAEAARSDPNGGRGVQALGALLAGPLVDMAADALIQPQVFRAVAEMHGYTPDQPIPSTIAITRYVRRLGGGSVCVVTKTEGPCVLLFSNEAGTWRLTGFEGDLSLLRPGR